ncbi:MAG: tRNA lysidine(34) synthetase TilS [Muribaculaceae bacterium]|nr:tRNA lysidine(34) synthetase TilS [Muribaculaceae bacterium]
MMRKNRSDINIIEQSVQDLLQSASIRRLIVGVSGGADSMALLHALQKTGAELLAVHCNFHLRGGESDRDMNHVLEYCKNSGIPCEIIHFDVESYRSESGGSVEMACRELRYKEFEKLKSRFEADRIAIAHNSDDQAETVLLNLMRGSGVAGLRGMRIDTGTILRPLLGFSRAEIEHYLHLNGVKNICDSSNLSSDYRRNFLRNEVIPLLESRWPEAKKSLCHTADIMATEENILDFVECSFLPATAQSLAFSQIKTVPNMSWIVRRFAKRFGATDSQVMEMDRGLNRETIQSGKIWIVKGGKIIMERDRLQFVPAEGGPEIKVINDSFKPGEYSIEEVKNSPLDELWTPLGTEDIEFRFPREGDRISPLGMPGSTLVSKVMKDNKLSTAQKEKTVIAVEKSSGEIIWIKGIKRSRLFLIERSSDPVYRYRIE